MTAGESSIFPSFFGLTLFESYIKFYFICYGFFRMQMPFRHIGKLKSFYVRNVTNISRNLRV